MNVNMIDAMNNTTIGKLVHPKSCPCVTIILITNKVTTKIEKPIISNFSLFALATFVSSIFFNKTIAMTAIAIERINIIRQSK